MPVDDLWFLTKKGPDGERLKSKRHGRGKRWRVRYNDDNGAPKQQLFEKKADAERHDANMRADVSRGQYVDPAAGTVTVAAYGKQWRANRLHRDSTAEMVERAFRLHIDPVIGKLRMSQARTSHVQGWVKNRSTELEPSTLRVAYSYLVSMFNTAVLDRVIGVSPCGKNIQLPDVLGADMFVPTAEQVAGLAEALPKRYRAHPYAAAGTGLRQGELWGLELDHVDFLRRKVRVAQQLKVVTGRTPFLAPLKTATSNREVEMGQVVAEALARHIEEFPIVEVEIDDETDPRRPITRMAKLLFLSSRGNPISRRGWSRTWTPAVAAAGLPEGFGFHGLRHFYATLLIHGGASVKTVQLALGHATPTITLNTYVGHWPDALESTRALVDNALRPAASALRAVAK